MDFKTLFLNGSISFDTIDDFVDIWHNSDFKLELNEFLGLSKKEYSLWVETNNETLEKELVK